MLLGLFGSVASSFPCLTMLISQALEYAAAKWQGVQAFHIMQLLLARRNMQQPKATSDVVMGPEMEESSRG